MRQRVARLLIVLSIGLVALIAIAGCEEPTLGNPLLPTGFADTPLPQAPLNGYLYVRPGHITTLATSLFTTAPAPQGGSPLPLPESIGLDALQAWGGPSAGSFGALLDLASTQEAQAVSRALESGQTPLRAWQRQEEDRVHLVGGADAWAEGLKTALQGRQAVTLQEAYPEAWNTIRLLPEHPPSPPIAAGFVRLEGELLEAWGTRAGISLQGLTAAAGALRIQTVAFALYGDLPARIGPEIGPDFLAKAGLGGIFVGRSEYPGFLLSWAFGAVEGRGPLEKVTLPQGTTAYSVALEPLHVMIAYRGRVVYGAVASSKEQAQALLLVALGVQPG